MDIRGIATLETKLAQFPRLGLAQLPTPLEPLTRLSAYLGARVCGSSAMTRQAWAWQQAPQTRLRPARGDGRAGRYARVRRVVQSNSQRQVAAAADPPPLKWSDLRYVFDIKEDCNGKEAIQA
jgi:L-cysteate sulfo-lyase